MSKYVTGAVLALSLLVLGGTASAQEQPDPASTARLLLGPVYLNPTFTLRDIGTDSNVFNDSQRPVEDFSATISPEVTGGFRPGLARVTFGTSLGLVFFRRYTDQNSVNARYQAQVDLPLSRIRPFIWGELLTTRERPGFEIDARARRSEPSVKVGMELKLTDITSVTMAVRRTDVDFEQGEAFQGTELRETLNRRLEAGSATMRFAVTPLTTLVLTSEVERTRFTFSPLRDSNGMRVTGGVEFQPDALFRGSAFIGYRQFHALAPGVPEYQGMAAAVSLAYTLHGSTKVEGNVDHDVAYSLEEQTPYYLSTGGNLRLTQLITGPLDVTVTIGRQRLDYRAVVTSAVQDRKDAVKTYGGGVGFRVGDSVRIGINVERSERTSNLDFDHEYDRTRVFASLTYGLN